MGNAMREIQHCINALKEAQNKGIISFLRTIVPDAWKGKAVCLLRPALLWKIEWCHANLRGTALGNVLVV